MSLCASLSRSQRLRGIKLGNSGYPTIWSMRSKLMNATDSLMILFNVGGSSSLMKDVNLMMQLWVSSYRPRLSNFSLSSSVAPLKFLSPSTRCWMLEKNCSDHFTYKKDMYLHAYTCLCCFTWHFCRRTWSKLKFGTCGGAPKRESCSSISVSKALALST